MIEKYCVFLRGVNANGVKMKMEHLKKAFVDMAYPDAKTILATGNVIISTQSEDDAVLKQGIEKTLSNTFSYDAHVFIRSAEQLSAVMSAAGLLRKPPNCHLYYLICDDKNSISELCGVFSSLAHQQNEALIPIEDGAFWIVPIGATLESAFGTKALGDKKYKNKLTSRSMNTIEKIAKSMRD